jgi:hypothetical protein
MTAAAGGAAATAAAGGAAATFGTATAAAGGAAATFGTATAAAGGAATTFGTATGSLECRVCRSPGCTQTGSLICVILQLLLTMNAGFMVICIRGEKRRQEMADRLRSYEEQGFEFIVGDDAFSAEKRATKLDFEGATKYVFLVHPGARREMELNMYTQEMDVGRCEGYIHRVFFLGLAQILKTPMVMINVRARDCELNDPTKIMEEFSHTTDISGKARRLAPCLSKDQRLKLRELFPKSK